jgi:DNA-binding MarR family transcriptional regulator
VTIARPPAPDPVLQFLQTIWQLEHALERGSKRMEDALGISGPQRFALRMIGGAPDISAGELAAQLHLHPSTVTGIVQRLVRRRLVRRSINAADGRVTHLRLTAAGARVNRPAARGTIEQAARLALARCSGRDRAATATVLANFVDELMRI